MIKQNRFSKYLLYAIGEIILVVIGILIALQINNANEAKKQKLELHGYLKNISKNMQKDSLEIIDIKTFRDSVAEYSKKIIAFSKQDKVTMFDFDYLLSSKYNVFFDNYLQINQSGYEALKNSGYIGKLQGTDLENLLIEYYTLVAAILAQEKSLNDFIERMEVCAFETGAMTILTDDFFEANPEDIIKFIKEHPEKILNAYRSNCFKGAYLRGMITTFASSYQTLIDLGDDIQSEIDTTINE